MDDVGMLSGVRIVDFSHVLSGPFATMLLGDMGADVIKVERQDGGDSTRDIPPHSHGESEYFMSVNRNKRSVQLDLANEKDLASAKRLVASANVVVENFRPGVMESWGLGFEDVRRRNRKIVYCSIRGFARDTAWEKRPAYDLIIQALSGAMSLNGEPNGGPVRMSLPVGDLAAGMFGALAIVGTLYEQRAGQGRAKHIEVDMLTASISLLTYLGAGYLSTGVEPERVGSSHPNIVPYGVYEARDGHIAIATLTASFWPKLCQALGLESLVADSRFSTSEARLRFRGEVDGAIAGKTKQMSVEEVVDRLEDYGIPCAPILKISETLQHPVVRDSGALITMKHPVAGWMRGVASPLLLMEGGASPVRPAPFLGEHTDEVLGGLET